MTTENFKRKLTAIFSADVEGYCRFMGEDEEDTLRTLTTYLGAMASLVQQNKGQVADAQDKQLAEFINVIDTPQATRSSDGHDFSRSCFNRKKKIWGIHYLLRRKYDEL